MDIKCIFYAEFDEVIGPVLSHQTPSNVLSIDTFRLLQTFLIPHDNLCGKLLVLNLKPDLCLVGLPVNIYGEKYERNSFEFNFGILVAEDCFN